MRIQCKISISHLRRSAKFVLDYALGDPVDGLTNGFVKSEFLKNRITMLYKNKNSNWSLGKYAAVALLVVFVSLLAASCGRESSKAERGATQTPAPVIEAMTLLQNTETDTLVVKNQLIPNYIPRQELGSALIRTDPTFPGGNEALDKFIDKNMKYPAAARRANVSGSVFLMFLVNADGSIQDIEVLKGLGFGCDEEAIRIMKQTPRWIPGTNDASEKVSTEFTMPIRFVLPKKKEVGMATPAETEPTATQQPAISFNAAVDSLVKLKFRTASLDEAARFKPTVWRPQKNVSYQRKSFAEILRLAILDSDLLETDQPLFVLDGVASPIDLPNYLDNLTPNDIESISVLGREKAKEAYGVRGAGGAVSIITKQSAKMPLDIKE